MREPQAVCPGGPYAGTMPRFLAIHDVPGPHTLEGIAEAAHAGGARPLETFLGADHAFTLFEAEDADTVVQALMRGGATTADIVPGARVHTDLLDPPRRHR